MITLELTSEDLQTIRDLIYDWGFEYSLKADHEKVQALAAKLGAPLPELRCARWPHCGCEGHTCGETT